MKQRILDFMERKEYQPMEAEKLLSAMEIEDDQLTLFFDSLRSLEADGLVLLSKKKRYGLCRHMGLLSGRIEGKNGGYAFFIPDIPNRSDLFIAAQNLHGALHGDRALVRVVKEQNYVNARDEGEVTRILQHANERLIGVFEKERSGGIVMPEDKRINRPVAIPKSLTGSAEDGDVVEVTVTSWGDGSRRMRGKVTAVIGRKNQPGTDMETVIHKYQLPEEFPLPVLQSARAVAKIEEEDRIGRRDLREEVTVTIDGADARDLDDAVSLRKTEDGHFLLGVHIADVGHYVPVGSPLDKEAYRRGTSVYFPDRVIPMLPKELSNGICSLNPREDRLTLSCAMEIDAKGRVLDFDIFESVICTTARMTYDDVNGILDGEEALVATYENLHSLFLDLDELREILYRRRQKRGALTFDFPEAKVILDEKGEPVEIRKRHHGRAESIIEECMIVANETVAAAFFHRDIPFIYRVHDCPNDEKILELAELIAPFGYTLSHNMADVRPYHFQRFLDKIEDRPEKSLLELMVLRTMSHAFYGTENHGHFGLASDCYTHFTSPIRRYPDLCIHRVIKDTIHMDDGDEERQGRLLHRLEDAALQSSLRERNAEDAEREAVDIKKAHYMAAHVDDEFDGVISGVASYGFYVELDNTVNGLVHVSTLEDDYYEYHPNTKTLLGKRRQQCFRLGDPVHIRVTRVNIDEHLIDFEFIDFLD